MPQSNPKRRLEMQPHRPCQRDSSNKGLPLHHARRPVMPTACIGLSQNVNGMYQVCISPGASFLGRDAGPCTAWQQCLETFPAVGRCGEGKGQKLEWLGSSSRERARHAEGVAEGGRRRRRLGRRFGQERCRGSSTCGSATAPITREKRTGWHGRFAGRSAGWPREN